MSQFILYLANKAYSSWSLRGWLACKLAGMPFEERVIPMAQPDSRARMLAVSPTGLMPCLHHDGAVVWESLAIGDYLAELFPDRPFWPRDRVARAHARAVATEMHGGFADLRRAMPMNVRRTFPGKGRTPEALANIARVVAIWEETRTRFGAGGPFLFGAEFTLADAMYAPVVSRFLTWQPELPAAARAYCDAVWAHPWLRLWRDAAAREPWTMEKYENF